MTQFNVSTVFSAINHMTAPIRQMQASVKQFTSQIHQSNQQVNKLGNNSALTKLQVHFRNLRGLVKDAGTAIGHLGAKLASLATPGLGSLAALAGGAYAGKELVQNSMGFETNEIKTMALLRSRKENKADPLEVIKQKSLTMIKDNQRFADTQVGETTDWNEWQSNMLMFGLTPDNAMRKMAGTFGALHKNGMPGFNETISSMIRGETGASDQIGQQMKSDKGVISILDPKTEKWIELGAKGTMEYKQQLIKFLQKDANNRFGFVSEMMGTSLDARISTIVSTFKTTFDEALRDTAWWEKSIKPFADAFNQSILNVKPKIKEFFDVIHQKFADTGLLEKFGKTVDKIFNDALEGLIKLISSIDSKSVEEFSNWISSLPQGLSDATTQVKDLLSALSQLAPPFTSFLQALTTLLNIVTHPLDSINPFSTYDPSTNHQDYVNAQKAEDEKDKTKINVQTFKSEQGRADVNQAFQEVLKGTAEKKQQTPAVINQTFTSTAPIQAVTTTSGTGPKPEINNTGNNSKRAQNRTGFMGKY